MSEDQSVTTLARRIIEAQGPISLAALMRLANTALADSYYQAQQPFGRDGDFITAPEISQMFGEMLALALADQWQRMGAPAEVDVVELGPGRGVLMADMLRTWQRAAPALLSGATVTLVEASTRLKEQQRAALEPFGARLEWSERLPETGRPMLLIANEFFDALPMRQFVRTPEGWRERMVNWTAERGFHDALGPLVDAEQVPDGDIWEYSPEAMLWAGAIGARLKATGGLALIIDYASRPGETSFRGIARHRRAAPLEQLGQVDLSAGVDFPAVAKTAAKEGARSFGPIGQGPYLAGLGIQARHDQLAARASGDARERLTAGLHTLTAPDEMGESFRVLALTGPDGPPPAALPPAMPGEA